MREWIETAGYSFDPERARLYYRASDRCGDIENGIAFSHGAEGGLGREPWGHGADMSRGAGGPR